MNLNPQRKDIFGQAEYLRNAQNMAFKTGNGLMAYSEFTGDDLKDGFIPAGTAVYLGNDNLVHKWANATADANGVPDAEKGAALTHNDVEAKEGAMTALLVQGFPHPSKVRGVDDAFKAETKGNLNFNM